MRKSNYFQKANYLVSAKNGKYGYYTTINGINYSEKALSNKGYTFVTLTRDEAQIIENLHYAEKESESDFIYEQKMLDRTNQIKECLKSNPLPIEMIEGNRCATVTLTDTFLSHYDGCGKGTAYVVDGFVVAWHYGYEAPMVLNAKSVQVMLSCSQICF